MRLKRLVVQGFKSFKDRTTIHFDEGITGIVGPNGCGKSNIVDALFWIMGEQSAKHLRGNSMKDVIFAGSSKYSPANWAEATLVLSNDEGKHIHIGNKVSSPTEIQLTRKLYKNGETEYRINNSPCRLKDIQEVFMDTGAGSKSYSIIAQGEIARLVQAKPIDRRTIIEEVAGITKFKVRKKESLKKIEHTQTNLHRLSDLKDEIEKNLKVLESQAEKAAKARTLKEKIKRGDLIVSSHKVFDNLKAFRDLKNKLSEFIITIESSKTEKSKLEIGLEQERIEKEEKTEQLNKFQFEYNEISKKLAAAEERLNSSASKLSEREGLVEGREKECSELENDLLERREKLEKLLVQKKEIKESESESFDYDEFEERIAIDREEIESKNDNLVELKNYLDTEKEDLHELKNTLFQNKSELEKYGALLQDLSLEIEGIEDQYSGVSDEISNSRNTVIELEKNIETLSLDKEKSKLASEELSSQITNKVNLLQETSKKYIQLESRKNSLEEINNSLDGIESNVSEFLSTEDGKNYQILGNLIQCDDQYTLGVQELLSDIIEALVLDSNDSSSLVSWCQENKNKRIDFVIPNKQHASNPEAMERLKLNGFNNIVALKDIIKVPQQYSTQMETILEGMYLAESLQEANKVEDLSGVNFKSIATFDGSFIARDIGGAKVWSQTGEVSKGTGVIARNNEIEKLASEVTVIEQEKNSLEKEVETLKAAHTEKQESFEGISKELAHSREEYAAKKSSLDSKVKSFEDNSSRLTILKNRKSEISKKKLALLEQEDNNSKQIEEKEEAIETRFEEYENKKEDIESLRDKYEDDRSIFLQKQADRKSFQERLSSVTSQVEDIQEQITKQTSRIDSNKEIVSNYQLEIKTLVLDLEELEKGNVGLASELSSREEVLALSKSRLDELLGGMREREDRIKELSQTINKIEKESIESRIKKEQVIEDEEQITRNIFEKYQVDLRSCVGLHLGYKETDYEELNDLSSMRLMETELGPEEVLSVPYDFIRKYGNDLKDASAKLRSNKAEFTKLGEINWQAIEDYDRQKIRFDFLKEQEVELRDSLEDLENAINHIDKKSKERFDTAFTEVNTRFEKVFPVIFGGGNAQLRLTGGEEGEDKGVDIIAQPPGKKMQNINLMSGGEKAMTAVSLIFSIFLVKPSPFCLLDEVDAPLDDANIGRFSELLREMSQDSQFILITHNKKTMELNNTLYGVTMQEPGISKAVSVQMH